MFISKCISPAVQLAAMAKIVPPMNFGLVEDGKSAIPLSLNAELTLEGFYRSAQPTELNFSFLEKLSLRSVIWVGAEEPSEILSGIRFLCSTRADGIRRSWLDSQDIQLHDLSPQVSLNPHFPPPYTDGGVVPFSGQCGSSSVVRDACSRTRPPTAASPSS